MGQRQVQRRCSSSAATRRTTRRASTSSPGLKLAGVTTIASRAASATTTGRSVPGTCRGAARDLGRRAEPRRSPTRSSSRSSSRSLGATSDIALARCSGSSPTPQGLRPRPGDLPGRNPGNAVRAPCGPRAQRGVRASAPASPALRGRRSPSASGGGRVSSRPSKTNLGGDGPTRPRRAPREQLRSSRNCPTRDEDDLGQRGGVLPATARSSGSDRRSGAADPGRRAVEIVAWVCRANRTTPSCPGLGPHAGRSRVRQQTGLQRQPAAPRGQRGGSPTASRSKAGSRYPLADTTTGWRTARSPSRPRWPRGALQTHRRQLRRAAVADAADARRSGARPTVSGAGRSGDVDRPQRLHGLQRAWLWWRSREQPPAGAWQDPGGCAAARCTGHRRVDRSLRQPSGQPGRRRRSLNFATTRR